MTGSKTASRAGLPPGHPTLPPARTAVLLLNLGTPDGTGYWPMRRYLKEFLWDRRVIEPPPARWVWWCILNLIILTKRPFTSGANYRSIWNKEADESPLLTVTRAQAEALRAALARRGREDVDVDFAMRYGNPSIESRVRNLMERGCERLVCFSLYPQYAAPTTATAHDQVFRALMKLRWQPALRTVPHYCDHPGYIGALAESVLVHLGERATRPDAVVASYHGLPKRYFEAGDPYHCHCQKTSRLLAERLGPDAPPVETAFQSRFGSEEWLQPYTSERVAELAAAGKRDIAILAPGFSADCVETLEEINGEIREAFLDAGGQQFTYIPCLNDDPTHVAALADIVEANLEGW